jgi:hypothetical protein
MTGSYTVHVIQSDVFCIRLAHQNKLVAGLISSGWTELKVLQSAENVFSSIFTLSIYWKTFNFMHMTPGMLYNKSWFEQTICNVDSLLYKGTWYMYYRITHSYQIVRKQIHYCSALNAASHGWNMHCAPLSPWLKLPNANYFSRFSLPVVCMMRTTHMICWPIEFLYSLVAFWLSMPFLLSNQNTSSSSSSVK